MKDLTVIYITANKMPVNWVSYQLKHLYEAIGDYPLISVSRVKMDIGLNLIDSEPISYWNIYMQILRACHIAETPFVAIAEDDVLYSKEHFNEFRPPMDSVSFNRSRWSLFSWDKNPIYCLRQRVSNCSVIAPRLLMIDALEERRARHPNGLPDEMVGEVGRSKIESRMGLKRRNSVEWYSTVPIIHLNHLTGTDKGRGGRIGNKVLIKKHGQIKAIEIPYWGKASDISRIYTEC